MSEANKKYAIFKEKGEQLVIFIDDTDRIRELEVNDDMICVKEGKEFSVRDLFKLAGANL